MTPGTGHPAEPAAGPYPLLLRPWAEADAAGLREAIDEDPGHLKPWLSWTLEEPASPERTRARLRHYIEEFRTGQAFRYAITPLERPSRILGGAHLHRRVGPRAHDVGYWVRRSVTRQGIAAAAVSALARHAFERPDVDRLVIQCDRANDRSAAFARALGFAFIGDATAAYADGTPRPLLRFALTRTEYDLRHAHAFRDRARRVRLVASPDEDPSTALNRSPR